MIINSFSIQQLEYFYIPKRIPLFSGANHVSTNESYLRNKHTIKYNLIHRLSHMMSTNFRVRNFLF